MIKADYIKIGVKPLNDTQLLPLTSYQDKYGTFVFHQDYNNSNIYATGCNDSLEWLCFDDDLSVNKTSSEEREDLIDQTW